MNIFDYIKYYGDYTFDTKPFNEIDNVVLSMISYVNFEGIVTDKEITLEEAYSIFKIKYDPKKKEMFAVKKGIKTFELAKKQNRYRDIKLSNYSYVGDEKSQFSAITFNLFDNNYYVAFRGTDELVSGWEEDFKMSYHFPVKAQVLAKNYLDKNFTTKRCKLIVGGHSKGGNLALVSSMYANYFVKKKIIKIYSNDGQGLRKAQLESSYYKKIEDKYIHIIPNYSVVGLILWHKDNYTIVKSNKKGVQAHDATTWQVSYDHFEKENLSRFSKVFDDGFTKWLDTYTDEDRKVFVKGIFNILKDNGIVNLVDIKIKKDLIINVLNSSKDINPLVKEMTMELIKIINKTNFEYFLF